MLASDSDPQTDTDNDSDTSCQTMTIQQGLLLGQGSMMRSSEQVREEGDRRPTVGNCPSPSIGTHKRKMLSHTMTGVVKWMPSYKEDTPRRSRWPF